MITNFMHAIVSWCHASYRSWHQKSETSHAQICQHSSKIVLSCVEANFHQYQHKRGQTPQELSLLSETMYIPMALLFSSHCCLEYVRRRTSGRINLSLNRILLLCFGVSLAGEHLSRFHACLGNACGVDFGVVAVAAGIAFPLEYSTLGI